jgi:uncharacterized protein (DUF2062 family)
MFQAENRQTASSYRIHVFLRFGFNADSIRRNRLLARLGPRLHDPRLWRPGRHAVALGVALGMFFAILIPIGQIPVVVAVALLLRCNPLAGAAATFISNPLTFGPIYYGAYVLGAAILDPAQTQALNLHADSWSDQLVLWWAVLRSVGPPLMLGLLLMAITAGVGGYLITHLLWRLKRTTSDEAT